MGYNIYINDCNIRIDHAKRDEALAAVAAYNVGKEPFDQFAIRPDDTLDDLLERECQLFPSTEAGYENSYYFDGEWFRNYSLDELWAILAPFVDDGSTIDWEGEDGDRWRYYFKKGKLYSAGAVITYPEPPDED